jgi:hypothetical protein
MTRSEREPSGHACLYGSGSIQGCARYDPVSAHSSQPGSDACRYLIRTPVTEHHWQRQCMLEAPTGRPRETLESSAPAPSNQS